MVVDFGFLGVVFVVGWQFFLFVDNLFYDLFDNVFGDNFGFGCCWYGCNVFCGIFIVVFVVRQKLCVEWLVEFGVVVVQCVGFQSQFLGQYVGVFVVFDGCIVWYVDCFGDCIRDEWLGCGYYVDVVFYVEEVFVDVFVWVGVVEYWIMFFFQEWCVFQGYCVVYMCVGSFYVSFGEVEEWQQFEFWIFQLFVGDVKCFYLVIVQCLVVEDEFDVEG